MRQLIGLIFLLLTSTQAYPADPPLPLCVHWTYPFINTEFMQHAQVVGDPEQRLYLKQQNPQLCAQDKLAKCETVGYLITNDRVVIGHECGSWAHVQFRSKKGRTTSGWVELERVKKIPPDTETVEARKKRMVQPNNVPLAAAIANGNMDNIKEIIKSGTDINEALDLAVVTNKTGVVLSLIQLGANPKTSKNPCRLLERVIHSNLEIIEAILATGANLNCTEGPLKETPLGGFASVDRAAVPLWASMGMTINPGIVDPEGTLRLFIKYGADLNIKNGSGETPLRLTIEHNNVDIAALLLEAGADVNNYIKDDSGYTHQELQIGDTALMEGVRWYELRHDTSLIKILLAHGADVNFRNEPPDDLVCDARKDGPCPWAGQTVLTRAARDGYYPVVKLLLEHGADPALTTFDGLAPAALARSNGYLEIAAMIEKYQKEKAQTKLP